MAIKKILVSQATPKAISAYEELSKKYGVQFEFVPFYKIEPVSSIEMRSQHCNPLDYDAIVFSSRSTIDAFFSLCEELRVKIPEDMKYFCTNEKVAMYLQKHIVYRKRKIFFGDGTPSSVLGLITAKHKGDKFLIITADSLNSSITKAFDTTEYKHSSAMFAKSVPAGISDVAIDDFDLIVMYNKADVASLFKNFPEYRQGKTAILTYGSESLKKAATDAGLEISLSAPSAEHPSVISAIEHFVKSNR